MGTLVEKVNSLLPNIEQLVGFAGQGSHPIHGSTTGSNLHIQKDKNAWYCFRCQVGGYGIHWISIMERVMDCRESIRKENFPRVLEIACKYLKIEKDYSDTNTEALEGNYYDQNIIYHIFTDVHAYFVRNLGQAQINWIKEKWGFDSQQISELGIGYAPPVLKGLYTYLKSLNYTEEQIIMSGLVYEFSQTSGSDIIFEYVDVFQGRMILPWNHFGHPSYFIGRECPWTPDTKYEKDRKYRKQLVHNEEKFPYVSRSVLQPVYGLQTLEKYLDREGIIIFAEGITDAMVLELWSYPVLSPVTTHFSAKQMNECLSIIRKYDSNNEVPIFICFDEESTGAGLRGALDTMERIPNDKEVYLVRLPLPQGKTKIDVNDYFKLGNDRTNFQKLLNDAIPRKETGGLWALFKMPYCIDKMISSINIPRNARDKWLIFVGKELYYTMSKTWEEVEEVLIRMAKTPKISRPKLDEIKQIVQSHIDIPVEHSCSFLHGLTIVSDKYCSPSSCYHVCDDLPNSKSTMIDASNSEEQYKKLKEIIFNELPKGELEREYSYEIIFPETKSSINISAQELDSDKTFARRYLSLFQRSLIMPGLTKEIRRSNWEQLRALWFENLTRPYATEIAGTKEGLIEEFQIFVDQHIRRMFTFEEGKYIPSGIEKHIFYIPDEQKIYIPIPLIRQYLNDRNFKYSLSQFRYLLEGVLDGNSELKTILRQRVRMWKINYVEGVFTEIYRAYNEYLAEQEEERSLEMELHE